MATHLMIELCGVLLIKKVKVYIHINKANRTLNE